MAIRLASAIGEQRSPIAVFGGLDDAINKTGDAIQAGQAERAKAAAKKADQEQQYKDLVAATLKPRNLEGVRSEDWEEDQKFQKEAFADILLASKDSNVTKAQLEQKHKDFIEGLQKREHLYKRDYDAISSVAKKQDTHDTSLFDNFLIGRTDPTQVSDMPNDDFFAASEGNRAGTMPIENLPDDPSFNGGLQKLPDDPNFNGERILLPDGSVKTIDNSNKITRGVNKANEMKRTETSTLYQEKPYFSKSIDERLKTDIRAKENELTALKRPNIVKAAQGYLGSDFKFGSLTKRTDKVSPTSGEYIYEFDEKGADELARKFASSVVGDGNFGSKDHSQYQRALEYEALRAGNEAGFSGDKLKEFVQEAVPRMAYDDFMKDARAAEADRSKNEKDITKAPGKGLEINFTSGGGASKGTVSIEPVKDFTPLDKEGIKRAEEQTTELKSSIKKANEIVDKYKNNPSSPAYQNAKKLLDASNKALLDLEEENLSRKKGFLMFSNKKAVDDAFIDINNDGKLMYRIIGFEPKEGGGYNVLGVKRTKTDEGNVDEIKNMDLTESVYKKIIAENPDADVVMNKLGVKPSAETSKAEPKKETPKAMTQEEFNKKWASLKKGESIVAPNGQTYKKK